MILNIITVCKKSSINLIDNSGVEHAGYMAFMLILCLFPSCVVFLLILYCLGLSNVIQELLCVTHSCFDNEFIYSLQKPIQELICTPPQELLTIFLVSYIWTASSFIEGLRTILNRVYKVAVLPSYFYRRLTSCLQLMFFILIAFCIAVTYIVLPKIHHTSSIVSYIMKILSVNSNVKYLLFYLVLFTISSYFYIFIPNVKLKFVHIIPGACITSISWIVSVKYFCKHFIRHAKISVVYGSLGNIVLTLLLFYILNLIFIYGAEFNYAYSTYKNNPIQA